MKIIPDSNGYWYTIEFPDGFKIFELNRDLLNQIYVKSVVFRDFGIGEDTVIDGIYFNKLEVINYIKEYEDGDYHD